MTAKKTSKVVKKPTENSSGIETITTDSAFLAACTGHAYTEKMFKGLDMSEMSRTIKADVDKVNKDDLSGLVGMLVSQAHTLQLMFTHLARRANGFEQLKQYQAFMNMALKTQAQSRATIQAVADLKFPRQVIVTKQANISQGHQQVNNGNAPTQSMPVTHAPASRHWTSPPCRWTTPASLPTSSPMATPARYSSSNRRACAAHSRMQNPIASRT